MKYLHILNIVFLMSLVMGCQEDELDPKLPEDITAAEITSPSDNSNGLMYEKANEDSSITFTWSEADFGYQASITYALEMSLTDDFAESVELFEITHDLTNSVTVASINSKLLALDMSFGDTATVKLRMSASISDYAEPVTSDPVDYTVVPYEALKEYPMIYVPGNYQGWSPGAENGILYSYESNTTYEGILRLDGEFKITPEANWDNSWGGTLPDEPDGNGVYSGTLDASAGNMDIAAGTYEISVDTDALTITLTPTDDWGIIGSAINGGASDDTDMTYDGQRQKWTITGDFTAGEFKFRANDSEDLTYGDTDADGTLDEGGTNITLESDGNYTIRLDLINNEYNIIEND